MTPDQVGDKEIWITGADVNHICNVLRMKIGEELKISDGNNQNYLCAVEEMTKESVRVKILETFCTDTESSCRIVLFPGVAKER